MQVNHVLLSMPFRSEATKLLKNATFTIVQMLMRRPVQLAGMTDRDVVNVIVTLVLISDR